MRLKEIIFADWKKHYADREISAEFLWESFVKYCNRGEVFFTTEKVVTILKYVGNNTIEFHCMNGGNGKDLTEAVNLLTNKLSDKYDKAVTYFDNPRISEFVKYSDFPAEVKEVNLGTDMKYELTIYLGAGNGRS